MSNSLLNKYLKYQLDNTTARFYFFTTVLGFMVALTTLNTLYILNTDPLILLSVGAGFTIPLGLTLWRWVMKRQPVKTLGWLIKLNADQIMNLASSVRKIKHYKLYNALSLFRSFFLFYGLLSTVSWLILARDSQNITDDILGFQRLFIALGFVAVGVLASLVSAGLAHKIRKANPVEPTKTEETLEQIIETVINPKTDPSGAETTETPKGNETSPRSRNNAYRTWDGKPKYGEEAPKE